MQTHPIHLLCLLPSADNLKGRQLLHTTYKMFMTAAGVEGKRGPDQLAKMQQLVCQSQFEAMIFMLWIGAVKNHRAALFLQLFHISFCGLPSVPSPFPHPVRRFFLLFITLLSHVYVFHDISHETRARRPNSSLHRLFLLPASWQCSACCSTVSTGACTLETGSAAAAWKSSVSSCSKHWLTLPLPLPLPLRPSRTNDWAMMVMDAGAAEAAKSLGSTAHDSACVCVYVCVKYIVTWFLSLHTDIRDTETTVQLPFVFCVCLIFCLSPGKLLFSVSFLVFLLMLILLGKGFTVTRWGSSAFLFISFFWQRVTVSHNTAPCDMPVCCQFGNSASTVSVTVWKDKPVGLSLRADACRWLFSRTRCCLR